MNNEEQQYNTDDDNENFIDSNEETTSSLMNIHLAYSKKCEEILENYQKHLADNLSLNLGLKKIFFVVCCLILVCECLFQFIVIDTILRFHFDSESSNLVFSAIVSMTTSFLSTFIILPIIIARYLFNKKRTFNNA